MILDVVVLPADMEEPIKSTMGVVKVWARRRAGRAVLHPDLRTVPQHVSAVVKRHEGLDVRRTREAFPEQASLRQGVKQPLGANGFPVAGRVQRGMALAEGPDDQVGLGRLDHPPIGQLDGEILAGAPTTWPTT